MNSELEKLIEKYRITVNGLADLEAAAAEKVIKERGFVTLNGLLAATGSPAGEGTENAVNTENTPVAPAPVEGSNERSESTPVAAAPVENPGVTPVPSEPAVSDSTNLGNEVSGERTEEETASEEDSSEEEGEPTSGGKPKKKKK